MQAWRIIVPQLGNFYMPSYDPKQAIMGWVKMRMEDLPNERWMNDVRWDEKSSIRYYVYLDPDTKVAAHSMTIFAQPLNPGEQL